MAAAADDDVEVSDDDEDGDGPADLQADIMDIAEITDAASASKIMKLRLTDATRKIYAFVFPAKAYEQRQNEEIRCLSSKTLSLVLGCGICDRLTLETPQWRSSQSCDKGAVGWSTISLFFSSLSRIGYRSPFPCQ